MQFALVGDVQFELITYFEGLDGSFGVDYAEHARIEGKPRLQFIGERLDGWLLKLRFHVSYCDPEKEVTRLRKTMSVHMGMPFILANGDYKGDFVITDVSVTSEQTDPTGSLVSAEADMRLKEFVAPDGVKPVRKSGPAVIAPGAALPSGVAQAAKATTEVASATTSTLGSVKSAVAGAVKAASSVTAAISTVKSTMDAVRSLASNPLGAIAKLSSSMGDLGRMGGASETLAAVLGPVRDQLKDVGPVINVALKVSTQANQLRNSIGSLSPDNVGSRVASLSTDLRRLEDDWHGASVPLAKLTAQVVARTDIGKSA